MNSQPETNGIDLNLLIKIITNESLGGVEDYNIEYYISALNSIFSKLNKILYTFIQSYDETHITKKQEAILYQLVFFQLSNNWIRDEILARLEQALNAESSSLVSIAIDGIRLLESPLLIKNISYFLKHESSEVRSSILKFLIRFNKNNINIEDLIYCFESSSPEDDNEYYYDAAILIYKQGPNGISFLFKYFDKALQAVQKRAILYALTLQDEKFLTEPLNSTEVTNLLLKSLDANEWEVIVEAIESLKHLKRGDFQDRIVMLQNHSSPYVQGAVLRYLSMVNPERAFPILLEALDSSQFIVRETAADELGELSLTKEQKAQALLRLPDLLVDGNSDVREAAKAALRALTGDSGLPNGDNN